MDARVLRQDRAAQEDATQRVVARPERTRLDRGSSATGDADAHERAAVRESFDAVDQVLAAYRVDHDVHAARFGQLLCALDEAVARVVDPVVEAELLQPFEL